MRTSSISLNPFSLMMEPEAVLQAMERSQSLRRLTRHKLCPLDRPLIPHVAPRADDEMSDEDNSDDGSAG
ncbi:MAG: hypothetical protein OEW36_02255 [Hylemonella sp.]|nr:hypothetical protein [Hylemonella sp.]